MTAVAQNAKRRRSKKRKTTPPKQETAPQPKSRRRRQHVTSKTKAKDSKPLPPWLLPLVVFVVLTIVGVLALLASSTPPAK